MTANNLDPYGHFGYSPQRPPAPYAPVAATPSTARPRSLRTQVLGAGAAAIAAALVVGGVAVAEGSTNTIAGSGSAVQLGPSVPGTDQVPADRRDMGTTQQGTGAATAAQQTGIVTVTSVLKYQEAESAGTGMVLTSDGEILTNNHVIDGATTTTVTVVSTGKTYQAEVVGTDPGDDVAVLRLKDASGLQTAKLGDSDGVSVGDAVTGVGNAGGTGSLTASAGSVTALDQTITASSEGGADAERLHNLIEMDAPIIAGDSGGPLYDSSGAIVGMTTAASSNQTRTAAYAIPIDSATAIAAKIETGVQTTAIHIGYPGFLAISSTTAAGGVGVAETFDGGPAARAGIVAGSVITKIDGSSVTSPTALRARLSALDPGSRVTVTWVSPDGATRTATVALASGPAD